ncbi:MAG: hypothetical protein LM514_01025, partial [Streptococcus sp.]|nr:hypothetical protein [Streptococcus sp.]
MVTLDNSNSMDEAPSGAAAGSFSPDSKSLIARNVVNSLVATYTGKINMGLMTYKLNAPSTNYVHSSPYDCSYNAANYDPNFNGARESTTKRFRVSNPTDPGNYVYYNVALPFYSGSNQGNAFCYSAGGAFPSGGNNSYRCYNRKTGNNFAADGSNTTTASGYVNNFYNGTLSPTDSDFAQGISSFGQRLSWFPVGPTWFRNDSPGRGYLEIPIRLLDSTQTTSFSTKLACNVPNITGYSAAWGCTTTGIRNAGLTPIEGTLYTARDYFGGTWRNASEGYLASVYPLPPSCGKDFNILVTDGLPSNDRNGNPISNPATAIAAAATAAAALNTQGVETYVVGFALPYGTDPSTLNSIAASGGTGTAYFATDSATLTSALNTIFLNIQSGVGSASAVTANSTRLDIGTAIYQSKFDSEDWSGQLTALPVNQDSGTIGTALWDTDTGK